MLSSTPASDLDYWHAEYTRRGMTMNEAAGIAVLGSHALVKFALSASQLKFAWHDPEPGGWVLDSS